MSKPPSPDSKQQAHPILRVVLPLAVLVLMALAAIGMLFIPVNARSAEMDSAAAARAAAEQCAMGMTQERKSQVTAGLQKFFSGLQAGASVSSSEIGAIADKIAPTDQGAALYKAYADCLRDQTTILLPKIGVRVVSEADKDELVRQAISSIGPDTPTERLIEIFGQPLSSGVTANSDGLSVDIYRYKFAAQAYDYRSGKNRVGLVLATKDPMLGQSMLFDQIAGVNVAEAFAACGGVSVTARQNGVSGICPASSATQQVAKVYFFPAVGITGMKKEAKLPECAALDQPDPTKCPGFASAPALAVAMVRDIGANGAAEKRLERVAQAFSDETDFGGGVGFLSPAEAAAFDKRMAEEAGLSNHQLQVNIGRDAEERGKRYKALLP